jgi:hypothetical protein
MGSLSRDPAASPPGKQNRLRATGRDVWGHVVRELLFFAFLFLYLWLVVEPHLIFHGADRITNFPPFYATWTFFSSHLGRPGGLVAYVSAFLSQLFYFSWLGALVITLQAWTMGLLVAYMLGTASVKILRVVRYVPALLLLVIYGRYTYFFPTTMALVVALALACVYACLTVRRTAAVSATCFMVLSLVCYYAAGGAMLLFALTCVIRELLSSGRRWLGVSYPLVAAGLPYVFGVKVIGIDVINAYCDLLPVSWKLLNFDARRRGVETVYVLYLLTPVAMVASGIASQLWTRWRRNRRAVEAADERMPSTARVYGWRAIPSRCVESPICGWTACTVLLIAVGAAAAYGSFDAKQKTRLAVDYCAYHKMWPELLVEGRQARDDPLVMHAVNRALYHTGQLGDEMFAWPQDPAYLFLTDTEYTWVYWQCFAAHLEMGAVNIAENALMECLAGLGERPMILQQLALINLVKANLGTARVYLHTLERTLFHGVWARHYLGLLERDPDLTTDENVQHLRSVAMEKDHPSLRLPKEDMLLRLLDENKKNRMAFEYLMAWYLSNRQLSRFVGHLDELRDLGYQAVPRHYEEAILVYAAKERTSIQLDGYEPQDEVLQQIKHFIEILRRHGGDAQAARADLAKDHGNTYAFYNVYSPRKKSK